MHVAGQAGLKIRYTWSTCTLSRSYLDRGVLPGKHAAQDAMAPACTPLLSHPAEAPAAAAVASAQASPAQHTAAAAAEGPPVEATEVMLTPGGPGADWAAVWAAQDQPEHRGKIRGRPAAGSWPGGGLHGATRRAGTPPG
jgi:hypothetical protein